MTQPTPARTYDESNLFPIDLTNLVWARTWARQLLKDFPEVRTGGVNPNQPTRSDVWPEFTRSDAALNAALFLDSVLVELAGAPTRYYRPHFTAARLYLGDPNLWRTRTVDGGSETRRDPNEVIQAWLNQGRALDALFPVGTVLPPFEVVDVETTNPGAPEWSPSAIPIVVGGL